MKKSKFFILIIVIFSLFIVLNSSISAEKYDIRGIAEELIKDGVGNDIIDTMIKKNLFSQEVTEKNHTLHKFNSAYWKNDRFGFAYEVLTGNEYAFKSGADEYLNDLFNVYKQIVVELEQNGKLKDIFEMARKDNRNDGSEVGEAIIESVAMQILNLKVSEASKSYDDNCGYYNYDSGTKKFAYDGKSYSCNEIYYIDEMTVRMSAIESFYSRFANLLSESNNNYQHAHFTISNDKTVDSVVRTTYTTVTGKTSQGSQTSNSQEGSSENEFLLNYEAVDSTYYPRLTNAFKFANDLYNAGKLDSLLVGKEGTNTGMLEVVNQLTVGFGKIGTYVMYALIIALGVVAIWSGVNGKVRFSETLPYAVVAIILFYLAPGIISIIKDIYTGATQDELWFDTMVKNLFATLVNIIRTLAFMGIILNGVKLMFGGAKEKANVKSSVVPLFIGSILVFAASIVVSFVLNTADQIGINEETGTNSTTSTTVNDTSNTSN